MATRRGPVTGRTVVDGNAGVHQLVSSMARFAEGLAPATSWEEVREQAPGIIGHRVAAMVDLFGGHDTFDVLELVRQHETPLVPDGHRESLHEGLGAVIDLVALVALSLGTRTIPVPEGKTAAEIPPTNQIIEPLCSHARDIVKLASLLTYSIQQDAGSGQLAELADLAGQLRSSEILIRNKHYHSIGNLLNEGVLDAPHIRQLLTDVVGFDYTDVQHVATAIKETYLDVKNSLLSHIGRAASAHHAGEPLDPAEKATIANAFSNFFVRPGASSSFTARSIAKCGKVPVERVQRILNTFSTPALSQDPETLVAAYVEGRNPLAGIGLITDDHGNYLMLQDAIPVDYVRRIIERKIKEVGGRAWDRYGRHRDQFAEKQARKLLATLLDVSSPTYPSLKYLAPPQDNPSCDLTQTANNPKSYAHTVEGDGLFVIGDVAICLETKAGSITDKARSGNVQRMADDLRKTIGEATTQAQRLESLILNNQGLWRDNGKWIDLSGVREVHSIVACLDDFGPLAIAADALVRADLLGGTSIPWIVSLHDLAVTAKVLTTPASFLLYVRRRTEPQAARLFVAVDELDVLMWFVRGELYFEADPDAIHARYPKSPPPTNRDRVRFKKQVPTRIGTLTDDLDSWMYYEEGTSHTPAPRPARSEHSDIERLVAFLQDGHKPGWLRFGADLLNLSSQAQKSVIKNMKDLVKRTRNDRSFHSLVQGYQSPWGYALLFAAAAPASNLQAFDRLRIYMTAKKHQLQADCALGFLLDENSELIGIDYQNDPYQPDEELDNLIIEMRLVAPDKMPRTMPPPSRRKPKKSQKRRK